MMFKFNQGVPKETTEWLKDNVQSEKWEIRREIISDREGNSWYTPCVFIYDEQCATMFALMWLAK